MSKIAIFKKNYIILLKLLLISVLASSPVFSEDWDAAKKNASKALEEGHCTAAWKIIWTWAKSGNLEARRFTAEVIINERILPIGLLELFRHGEKNFVKVYSEIILYGAFAGSENAIDMAHELLEPGFSNKSIEYEKLEKCLKKSNGNHCLEIALAGNIVKPFREMSDEFDKADSQSNIKDETCWNHPNIKR